MIKKIGFQHIGEVIEFLRGKTVIEAVTVKLKNGKHATERLLFSFLDYVTWPYGSRIKDTLRDDEEIDGIEVTARQLFKKEGENFTIGFKPESVGFGGVSNIEDTLLLDLKRYLEANAIPYEVNTNGPH